MMSNRAVAAHLLQRITDQGAYSNIVLHRGTEDLDDRDAGMVYWLVTATLRALERSNRLIESVASRPLSELDPEVRAVLRVAATELLAGHPPHAVVNESVSAIRELGKPAASGFVNAVLRKAGAADAEAIELDPAAEMSVAPWLLSRLEEDHGPRHARDLLRGLRDPSPPTVIRLRSGVTPPEAGGPVEGIAGAWRLAPGSTVRAGWVVQDAASIAVGLAVAARPGEVVLDMAAAPGGKTAHLWDQMEGRGTLVAMDSHRRRLESTRRRLRRMGVEPVFMRADGRVAPFRAASFDRVLLDAPCTGLGTLRRRPEIALRLTPESPDRLAAIQRDLLGAARRLVKPGGLLVYSVCTLFGAETVDVVSELGGRPPPGLPGETWGGGLLLAPHLTGTDGMFISVIRPG